VRTASGDGVNVSTFVQATDSPACRRKLIKLTPSPVCLGCAAVLAAAAGTAHADDDDDGFERSLSEAAHMAEMVVPDLRLELPSSGDSGLVLSWPLTLSPFTWILNESEENWREGRRYFAVQPFIEPQVRSGKVRIGGGTRLIIGQIVLAMVEGGGLAGEDGHGGFAGAGIGRSSDPRWMSATFVVRRVWTTEGYRVDFCLDFQFPLND